MLRTAVIDRSVLVASLIGSAGPAREILRRCLQGQYLPLMGNALLTEHENVLTRADILEQWPVSPDEIRRLLNALYSVCTWVPVYFLWRPNLRDEADNHVVELAVAGHASWLITQNLRDFHSGELLFGDLSVRTPDQILRGERHGDLDD